MVTLYLLHLQVDYMTGRSAALILMDTGHRALTPVGGNILPVRGTGKHCSGMLYVCTTGAVLNPLPYIGSSGLERAKTNLRCLLVKEKSYCK